MKIIITGATSFIGLHLMQYLLDEGHEVIAVCRKNSRNLASLVNKNVEIVFSDMQEYSTLGNKIINADAFINLAWGGTTHKERFNNDIHEENIKYSLDALEVAENIGCKIFVEAGSQAEYGICTQLITTDTPTIPFSDYGKAKLRMKQLAFEKSEEMAIKYLHLRIFSTYGEGDKPWTMIISCLNKMLNNAPVELSPCTQKWNFLYVKDAVKQIAKLIEYGINTNSFKHEVFHIASKDTRVLKDFILEMKSITNSNSDLLFGAIQPQQLVSLDPDISKTENAIGFISNHTFENGISHIINNMRND